MYLDKLTSQEVLYIYTIGILDFPVLQQWNKDHAPLLFSLLAGY